MEVPFGYTRGGRLNLQALIRVLISPVPWRCEIEKASSWNLKPHGEGQLMIQRPWKRAEPFGARSWTSYSSRLVIRKSTIDYQTQLGEHLNCWKASRKERYAYRNCSLFAIHIHLFSQEGGLCKVLVASTPLMWTKMVGKMLSLLRRKS